MALLATDSFMSFATRRFLFKATRKFYGFCNFLIVINALAFGLITDESISLDFKNILERVCDVSIWIFVVELTIRLTLEGRRFFTGRNRYWNYFDSIIIILSLAASVGTFASFRIFRVFRVFRQLNVLRVVRSADKLKTIVAAIFAALPGIMWTSVLFFIIMYTYALVGTAFFGHAFPEFFGNAWKSLYSLFQVMTLESWSMGIARPVMAEFSYAWIYFVSYVLIGSYVILNIIVALVVSSLQEVEQINARREIERKKRNGEYSELDVEIERLRNHLDDVMKMLERQKKR